MRPSRQLALLLLGVSSSVAACIALYQRRRRRRRSEEQRNADGLSILDMHSKIGDLFRSYNEFSQEQTDDRFQLLDLLSSVADDQTRRG